MVEAVSKGVASLFFLGFWVIWCRNFSPKCVNSYMSKNTEHLFKPYHPNQVLLLPPSLSEKIPSHHPVRVVSEIIDKLDLTPILARYPGGGSSSYHPRMMLKILVYAYLRNIFSSRKIEMAVREHIHFMWLAGGNEPDHHSINRFRGNRMEGVFKEVFSQVVLLLHEAGHLSLQQAYIDGTKLEANANRYTFVWAKSIQHYRQQMADQLEELWQYAQSVAKAELGDSQPCDLEKLDPQAVAQTIEKIDQALKEKPEVDEKKKAQIKRVKKEWPENLRKYQRQEQILDGRNSYSKTDPDATFMRLKRDERLSQGQLRPGYNLQMSTHEQWILHFSIHPNPTDTLTLKPHLEEFKQLYDRLPEAVIGDAGYGSEENYQLLEEKEIEAFVKHNYFHQENKPAFIQKHPFHPRQLYYDQPRDRYICPMGQPMEKIGTLKRKTDNGFEQTLTQYQAKNCQGCPLRGVCHQGKGNRIIQVNHPLNQYRAQARERLESEEGIKHRKQRNVDVEAVFGILKQNRGFHRLALRGKEKVEIEVGLHALAHNLRKLTAKRIQKQPSEPLLPLKKMEMEAA